MIKYEKVLFVLIMVFGTLFLTGCFTAKPTYINLRDVDGKAKSPVTREANRPLKVAVAPVLSQKETVAYYRQIVEHLSIQLGKPIELIQRQSNAEVSVMLANGGADLAFFSTGAYLAYNGPVEIEPIVMQQRRGVAHYIAYIVVPANSDVKKINDLRGRSFAFTDPLSFSGHQSVVYLLKQQQEKPETFFSNYLYTYSHSKALRAVANKIVDGAAVDSLAYDYARVHHTDIIDNIRIIGRSVPAGTGPVVVRKNMEADQKELISSIFLNMHHNADMRQALQGLMIDRFILPRSELYEPIRQIIDEVRREQ